MPGAPSKDQQAAARKLRCIVEASIRTDWRFPNPPNTAINASGNPQAKQPTAPTVYSNRYFGPSDEDGSSSEDGDEEESNLDEEDSDDDGDDEDVEDFTIPSSLKTSADVSQFIAHKKEQIKAKRKYRQIEKEMAYNQGLCFFLRCRNAWTGVVPEEAQKNIRSNELQTDADLSSSPFSPPPKPSSLLKVSLPIASPIIPRDDEVIQTIISRPRLDLYSKLITESRSSFLPINLSEIIPVLVAGWQHDGNWPPKGSAGSPTTTSIVLQDTATVVKPTSNRPSGIKQGIESVKRVFRLSGVNKER